MKTLSSILEAAPRNEFQSPRSVKDKKALDNNKKSIAARKDKGDKGTNTETTFKAVNVKTYDRSDAGRKSNHGYNPGADVAAYQAANEEVEVLDEKRKVKNHKELKKLSKATLRAQRKQLETTLQKGRGELPKSKHKELRSKVETLKAYEEIKSRMGESVDPTLEEGLGKTLRNIVSGRRSFLADRTDGGLPGLQVKSKKIMKKAPKGEFEAKFGHPPPAGMDQFAIKRWTDSKFKKAPAPEGSYGPKGSYADKTGSGDAHAWNKRKKAMGENTEMSNKSLMETIAERRKLIESFDKDSCEIYDKHHGKAMAAIDELKSHLTKHKKMLDKHKDSDDAHVNHSHHSMKSLSRELEDVAERVKQGFNVDGPQKQGIIQARKYVDALKGNGYSPGLADYAGTKAWR